MHAANFFVPSFLKAINDNTKESLRSIMIEPSPGVYTFEMLQPHFCELLLSEVSSLFLHVIRHVRSQFYFYIVLMFSYQVLIA